MTLPPLLATTLQDIAAEVIDAVQTDSNHHFTAQDAQGPIWLILTATHLFEAAALPDGTGWSWEHELSSVHIKHDKGMIRDAIIVDTTTHPLPVGAGKQGKRFVRRVQDQQSAQPSLLSPMTPTWFEQPPEPLRALIRRDLHLSEEDEQEPLLASTGVTPGDHLANAQHAWLILGVSRTLLYWWSGDSIQDIASAQHMSISTDVDIRLEPSLGRDAYFMADLHLFNGPLIGTGNLRELSSWSTMSPRQRMLEMASVAISQNKWLDANELLSRAQYTDAINEHDDEILDLILLQRARVCFQRNDDHNALNHLITLTQRRPEDDLIDWARQTFTPADGWWIVVALAHEEAEDYQSAASVYGHIADRESSLDAFRLQQARSEHLAGRLDESIIAYDRFIQGRLKDNEFSLTSYYAQHMDNLEETGGDPDLAAACGELGQILEDLTRHEEAASLYLTLIRQAPFDPLGYERLFRISAALEGQHRIHAAQAASIARILDPRRSRALFDDLDMAPIHWDTDQWMTHAAPLEQTTHDTQIVHEGERASSALAQKWLSQLITDPRSTSDIELHCQRLTIGSHTALLEALDKIATLLNMQSPRVYLSHGMSGVQVMGTKEAPFVLMGAIHLADETAQTLALREQVFALGSQMEHIKAGHLVLTSSEFWGAFRSRSLDGLVTVLSLIPIGGMLGKMTDKFAGSVIDKLRTSWDNAMVKQAVSYAEKSLKDGTGGHVQGAYEATLGRVVLMGKKNVAQESLLKEQLADFARCAMYTADRVGLLAADDLRSAIRAILLLSVRTHTEIETLKTEGLSTILSQKHDNGDLVYMELALRFGELFKFALSDEYLELRRHLHGELHVAPTPLDDQDQGDEATTPPPDATTHEALDSDSPLD